MPVQDVLIVGAGPAGLACAAALGNRGISAAVLEQADQVAAAWRKHYDRLHLHTDKRHSSLPGLGMPGSYPKYPSRDQLVEYLESYADHHSIAVKFGQRVEELRRGAGHWIVKTGAGDWRARCVVLATGIAGYPYVPPIPGLDSFTGNTLHSSEYTNATTFRGQRVLVVGFGNSGGEIARDLAENGVDITLSVRGPVNVLPREIFGIPVLSWAIAEAWMPPRLADWISAPLIRWTVGDIRGYGLERSRKGPTAQVVEDGSVPLIDSGTLKCLVRREIALRRGIEVIEGAQVRFTAGAPSRVDAIVFATGYHPDLRAMLPEATELIDGMGRPRRSEARSGRDGLYLCNYQLARTGQLRGAGIEARRIAARVATYLKRSRARRLRQVGEKGDSLKGKVTAGEQPLSKLHRTR